MNNPNSDWLNGWLFSAGGSIRRPQILQRVPHGSRLQVNKLNYLGLWNQHKRDLSHGRLFVDGKSKFKSKKLFSSFLLTFSSTVYLGGEGEICSQVLQRSM